MHKILETYLQIEMDIVRFFQSNQGLFFGGAEPGTVNTIEYVTIQVQLEMEDFGEI